MFFVFYSEVVYSVSCVFLSFYYHSCFRFHPLFHLLLFWHCFLPQSYVCLPQSYVSLFLLSFGMEVFFCRFRHNCSCNKLQVFFLSRFLSSNNIFYFWFFRSSIISLTLSGKKNWGKVTNFRR